VTATPGRDTILQTLFTKLIVHRSLPRCGQNWRLFTKVFGTNSPLDKSHKTKDHRVERKMDKTGKFLEWRRKQ
jgi:hypothetical protein